MTALKNHSRTAHGLSTAAAFALLAATSVQHAAAQLIVTAANSPYAITSDMTTVGVQVGASDTALVNHSAGTLTTNSSFILGGNAGGNGTYNLSGTGSVISKGTSLAVGGNGSGNFVQSGSSSLSFTSPSGILNIAGVSSSYSLADAATLTVGAVNVGGNNTNSTFTQTGGTTNLGGIMSIGRATNGSGTLNLSGGTFNDTSNTFIVGNIGVGIFNQTGGTFAAPDAEVDIGRTGGSTGTYNLSGGTASAASLVVGLGSRGTLNLSGAGALTINGAVTIGSSVNITNVTTLGTGTVNLNRGTLTTTNLTNGAGTSTLNLNGGTIVAKAASTSFISGLGRANVRDGGAILNTNGFTVTVPQALLHSDLSGDNATDGGVTKIGAGTLTLTGANTYTGATTVNAGTLQAGVASVGGVSGAFGVNSAVTMANVAGATLDLNNFNTQVGSLTGGGTTGGNVTLGTATLTVGGNNTSPAAFAGAISGTGGLTKIGTGTQTLSGSNTYTGATAVNAGTLLVNGSLSAATTTTVTGATLGGAGTINGTVIFGANSTIAPGGSGAGSTANLSLQSLILASSSVFAADLNGATFGTDYDRLSVMGNVALNGATLVLTLGYTPSPGDRLFLLDNDGLDAVVGTFAGLAEGQSFTLNGQTATISYNGDTTTGLLIGGNDVVVAFGAVPEPSTYALLIGGAGVLALVKIRRRQRAASMA